MAPPAIASRPSAHQCTGRWEKPTKAPITHTAPTRPARAWLSQSLRSGSGTKYKSTIVPTVVDSKMAATDEWKKDLELRDSEGQFLRSREFAKYLDAEYNATRSIMTELGLAK